MKLAWSERAKRDLVAIGRFIARDKPSAAREWVEKLRECARRAAAMPHAGRIVPEIERTDVREVFLRHYRIVYLVSKTSVIVLTVVEGHRLLPLDVGSNQSLRREDNHQNG